MVANWGEALPRERDGEPRCVYGQRRSSRYGQANRRNDIPAFCSVRRETALRGSNDIGRLRGRSPLSPFQPRAVRPAAFLFRSSFSAIFSSSSSSSPVFPSVLALLLADSAIRRIARTNDEPRGGLFRAFHALVPCALQLAAIPRLAADVSRFRATGPPGRYVSLASTVARSEALRTRAKSGRESDDRWKRDRALDRASFHTRRDANTVEPARARCYDTVTLERRKAFRGRSTEDSRGTELAIFRRRSASERGNASERDGEREGGRITN